MGKPNTHRPQFTNPVPLPLIESFRLDAILSKAVPEEAAAVRTALTQVNTNYQRDLRQEIRKTLTIEQKIQYKNIHVAKLAHALSKTLLRRHVAKPPALDTEVELLLLQTASVSRLAQGLAERVIALDKGVDGARFPLLAKLAQRSGSNKPSWFRQNGATAPAENGAERNGVSEEDRPERDVLEREALQREEALECNGKAERAGGEGAGEMQDAPNGQEPKTPDAQANGFHKNSVQEGPLCDTPLIDEPVAIDSDEFTPEDFELLVDLNVSKYRAKQLARETPKNPLRLLYSTLALANSNMLKAAPDDTFKNPFVTAKSIATVLLTSQLSHHKKLRINAVPVNQRPAPTEGLSQAQCQCELPAKIALAATLLKTQPEEELWSSQVELELDAVQWSSSDSSLEEATETDRYYLALRAARPKRRRPRKDSPSPMHQPSHRTLQPRGSILKIAKPCALVLTPVLSIPDIDTPYRASPRALFVTDFAAIGEILGGPVAEDAEDGDDRTVHKLRRLLL